MLDIRLFLACLRGIYCNMLIALPPVLAVTGFVLQAVFWLWLAVAIVTALGGCAVAPNTVTPQLTHMSHVTQHQPFTSTPTTYGANIASVALGWQLSKHVTLTVAEGVDLNRHYPAIPSYGEIIGPREQFTATVGYTFVVR